MNLQPSDIRVHTVNTSSDVSIHQIYDFVPQRLWQIAPSFISINNITESICIFN